jgi:hypothetical protein
MLPGPATMAAEAIVMAMNKDRQWIVCAIKLEVFKTSPTVTDSRTMTRFFATVSNQKTLATTKVENWLKVNDVGDWALEIVDVVTI